MRIIAFITNAADVKRILEHMGEASEPPTVSPSPAPPEEAFEFGPENDAVAGESGGLEPTGDVCAFGPGGACLGG